jgi:hypothetical protein
MSDLAKQLHPHLAFIPHHGPTPDPATLLQFFVEAEQPAARKQILAAYLQLSLENLQAQTKYLNAVQKALSHGG